jgi:16S rRNA processing protein RimM
MSEEQLPALGEKEYYWRDLIGATVVSLNQQCLGKVSSLLETGASDVLVVDPCEGSLDQRQRLIPFALDRVVVSVDTLLRQIQVDWDPEW